MVNFMFFFLIFNQYQRKIKWKNILQTHTEGTQINRSENHVKTPENSFFSFLFRMTYHISITYQLFFVYFKSVFITCVTFHIFKAIFFSSNLFASYYVHIILIFYISMINIHYKMIKDKRKIPETKQINIVVFEWIRLRSNIPFFFYIYLGCICNFFFTLL